MNMGYGLLAISVGAALGALLRYGLSLAISPLLGPFPLGTLVANLLAAFMVGAALAYAAATPGPSPLWRLFIVTGFAGGLSTFSSFSSELFQLLRAERLGWSLGMLLLHVGGSLLMVILGMAAMTIWRRG